MVSPSPPQGRPFRNGAVDVDAPAGIARGVARGRAAPQNASLVHDKPACAPQHRGVPASQPLFTIVEIATGLELATFESQAEAVAALAGRGRQVEERGVDAAAPQCAADRGVLRPAGAAADGEGLFDRASDGGAATELRARWLRPGAAGGVLDAQARDPGLRGRQGLGPRHGGDAGGDTGDAQAFPAASTPNATSSSRRRAKPRDENTPVAYP